MKQEEDKKGDKLSRLLGRVIKHTSIKVGLPGLSYEIDMICPQHGSIITDEKVKEAIDVLYNLEVGIWK